MNLRPEDALFFFVGVLFLYIGSIEILILGILEEDQHSRKSKAAAKSLASAFAASLMSETH